MSEVTTLKGKKALALWKAGRDKWNEWIEEHPDAAIDFSGVVFTPNAEQKNHKVDDEEYIDFAGFNFPKGRADFSKAMFTRAADFRNATFTGVAHFSNATFTGAAHFSDATFTGAAHFSKAMFTKAADFSNATFTGVANFIGATFTGEAAFSNATFTGVAHFSTVMFKRAANFMEATFTGVAAFSNATFTGVAHFSDAMFTKAADFSKAMFTGVAHFSDATFTGEAAFNTANFMEISYFEKAVFENGSFFIEAEFHKHTQFISTKFKEVANFRRSKFYDQANIEATFHKESIFSESEFKDNAIFCDTKFKGELDCEQANFDKEAKFENAIFQEKATFEQCAFKGVANFKEIKPEESIKNISFEDSSFGSSFKISGQFSRPVNLIGTKTSHHVSLSGVVIKGKNHLKEDIARFRRLKQLAEGNKSHQAALSFHAFEMRAIRKHELKGSQKVLDWLFEITSNYGQSILTPSIGLLVIWFFIACLHAGPGSLCTEAEKKQDTVICTHAKKAAVISMSHSLPFISGSSLVQTKLIDEFFDKGRPPYAWFILQGVLSFPLLFLIGLGLRNRFRI